MLDGRVVYKLPVTPDELHYLQMKWRREARKVKNKK
jgi:hypothetical protein